jgi:hypothetical protein
VSGGLSRQTDERIIVKRSDGFQCHVAGALHRPFVVFGRRGRCHVKAEGAQS